MEVTDPGSGDVETAVGNIEFTCPRCDLAVIEEFYGPCSTCREAMRTMHSADQEEVSAEAFEPKMNVTPNAVASKD